MAYPDDYPPDLVEAIASVADKDERIYQLERVIYEGLDMAFSYDGDVREMWRLHAAAKLRVNPFYKEHM